MLAGIGTLTAVGLIAGSYISTNTERDCANKMRRIVQAYNLYMADNQDATPPAGWQTREMFPYLHVGHITELFCPDAKQWNKSKVSTFSDVPRLNTSYHNSKTTKPRRDLPGGWLAPEFDIQVDAILKCLQHGSAGYQPSPSFIDVETTRNLLAKVQTAYLDGHVQQAYYTPCWELAWRPRTLYERYPYIVPRCDGKLERASKP